MTETVIVANGTFPKKGGVAWRVLAAAKRVVCCDGAADVYKRHFGKWPFAIVGDFDSVKAQTIFSKAQNTKTKIVYAVDQNRNDLEKAILYCLKQGWKVPVIVGATGKREDHTIGNIFRAIDYGCEIVTDMGRFIPVYGKASFKVEKGVAVSIFAPNPQTRMTSKGLEWPLNDVRFKNLYCATLNRAVAKHIQLTCTQPVSVFIEEGKIK